MPSKRQFFWTWISLLDKALSPSEPVNEKHDRWKPLQTQTLNHLEEKEKKNLLKKNRERFNSIPLPWNKKWSSPAEALLQAPISQRADWNPRQSGLRLV